jgi:hypothetical protein
MSDSKEGLVGAVYPKKRVRVTVGSGIPCGPSVMNKVPLVIPIGELRPTQLWVGTDPVLIEYPHCCPLYALLKLSVVSLFAAVVPNGTNPIVRLDTANIFVGSCLIVLPFKIFPARTNNKSPYTQI